MGGRNPPESRQLESRQQFACKVMNPPSFIRIPADRIGACCLSSPSLRLIIGQKPPAVNWILTILIDLVGMWRTERRNPLISNLLWLFLIPHRVREHRIGCEAQRASAGGMLGPGQPTIPRARPAGGNPLRHADIDRSGSVWVCGPHSHETEHRGRDRVILIGPSGLGGHRPARCPDDEPLAVHGYKPSSEVMERIG